MSYEEILDGRTVTRPRPGERHEAIVSLLHQQVGALLFHNSVSRLLERRTKVALGSNSLVAPDLALVTQATGKLWLAAEVIGVEDHKQDTVIKKILYENANLPRLWMIDPRYYNVEVYHGTQHGLALKQILAQKDLLEEKLLPGLNLPIKLLFGL
jgi:Uma2 family endonuclease